MTIQVQAPDGTIVEFPDGTPDDVMAKAMQETFGGPVEQMSVGKDVALSAASGLPRGVVETAMFPITASRMIEHGGNWLYNKAENGVRYLAGAEPLSDEELAQRSAAADDSPAYRLEDRIREMMDQNLHTPQTRPGKFAGTIAEFAAPGSIAGKAGAVGNIAQRTVENLLGNVVLPAVASEGAGQLAEGTPYEGAARLAGAVAGNFGAAAGKSLSAPESFLRRATTNMTPQDWERAIADQFGNKTGVKLSGPESVAQTMGGASALPNLLRTVEGSVEGRARTAPFFAARPVQVDTAVGNVLDQIAPQSAKPSTLGPISAENATNVIRGAEKARTEAVDPLYRAAATDKVPDDQVTALFDEIDNAIANDKTGILAGPLGELKSRLTTAPAKPRAPAVRVAQERPNGTIYRTTPAVPATPVKPTIDIENLDRARKYFRDKMDLPQIGQDAITKEQNAVVTNILTKLDDAMMNSSPKFREGKATFADISRNEVEPLTQGPVGRVAAANDTTAAGNAILPQNPLTGSAGEAADATRRLVAEDPATTKGLVRQNLADRYTKATTETQGADTERAGSKFHKDVAGNDTRSAVLDAVLREASPQAAASMDELLPVLQATGRRLPIGSATAFTQAGQADLGALSPLATLLELAKSGGSSLITRAGDATRRAMLRGNINQLADMFIAPDSVQQMRSAVLRGPANTIPDAVLRSVIEGNGAIYDPAGQR